MSGTFNPSILNEYLAPGFTEFTSAEIPTLGEAYPESSYWVHNHFLNNVFRGGFTGQRRQRSSAIVVRSAAIFSLYRQARLETLRALEMSNQNGPHVGAYCSAIVAWEAALINFEILITLLNHMRGDRVFDRDDGSDEQIAYDMANTVKHWTDHIGLNETRDDQIAPLWLTNAGIRTRGLLLTYEGLANLMSEVGDLAELLVDPITIRDKL